MDREAFKKRMQSLKSYRENNPGKGYWDWKRAIQDYKGIDIDNDPTYDYYGFYKENPETAKGILNDSKDAHFTDTYKTSVHPTFSNESKYSGYVNKYNPEGITGGYWGEDNSYNFSDSQIKNNWDIPNTLRYLEDAENYGVTAKYRGMYPKDTDNIIYGGVLPQVEVRAQAFEDGGETNQKFTEQDIVNSPYDDPSFVGKSYKGLHSILGKEAKDYIGNLNYLKSLSKFMRVFGPTADFVNYAFPQKESEYLYDTDKHFRDIVKKDKIQQVEMLEYGGETESKYPQFINGQRVNRWTGQPIATGQATPVLDLRTAADFTPVGDALAVNDAYQAIKNRDWLGLGLAGLGVVPFIPTVNKGVITNAIDKVLHRQEKANKVLEEFNRQRDDVYESLIENEEAFRRAANADRTSGSNYLGTYQQLIREHGSDNLRDKIRMEFDPNLYSTSTKAQVNPDDPTYITVNTRYKDPDELDGTFKQMNPGLIRHEIGHITDIRSGLDYTDKLADPAKFVSDEKLKEMFPSNYRAFRKKILNRGSEIKSYMNEFRQFLYDHGDRDTKETVKSFRRKLDAYGKDFRNLRMIFDSYKNPKQFIKDYNSVPLTSTDRNENLV